MGRSYVYGLGISSSEDLLFAFREFVKVRPCDTKSLTRAVTLLSHHLYCRVNLLLWIKSEQDNGAKHFFFGAGNKLW